MKASVMGNARRKMYILMRCANFMLCRDVTKKVLLWLIAYEASWLIFSFAHAFVRIMHGYYPESISSIAFIKEHDPLISFFSIVTCNLSSFFVSDTLTALHPVFALLAFIFMAVEADSFVLAAFMEGLCPAPHLCCTILESQCYLLLWAYSTQFYYFRKKCRGVSELWSSVVSGVRTLIILAFLAFATLAVIEVAEVLTYA